MRKEIEVGGKRVNLRGNEKNVARVERMLNELITKEVFSGDEGLNRIIIQREIADKVRCSILYAGNTVYGKETVLKDFKKIVKEGVESLTEDLYSVFHLHFGTIAHYNRQGWIANYTTINHIKELVRNASIPHWYTDLEEIRTAMMKIFRISPKNPWER
jgi:hypothetical protein